MPNKSTTKYKPIKPICPKCETPSQVVLTRDQTNKMDRKIPFETVRYCKPCHSLLHYNSFKKSWRMVISLGKRSK